jgi:iron complex outermembrane receptor protein
MRLRAAILTTCLVASAARADELTFEDHMRRAGALAAAESYREAVRELDAAYELRQSPRVLYELARAHARLGERAAALDCYARFLVADPAIDPALRAEVERAQSELRGPPVPVAPVAPAPVRVDLGPEVRLAPVRMELQSNHGLVAGGGGRVSA